ncbi:MAG: transcription elongation factor GreB [Porticoccaceae bacterium]|nr:transcription elongation factor GreB [Porticoccaceae bacterium]
MSRYRSPRAPSSLYITAQGATKLRDELQQLWKVERPIVTATVNAAAKNGDRSENGDYIYGKRHLREIDSRVRYLSKRLENVTIVDQLPTDQNRVYFGAWVSVENSDGKPARYRIVGSDEIDPSRGYISIDSPLALALLGKACDDTVEFHHDNVLHTQRILTVGYDAPNTTLS